MEGYTFALILIVCAVALGIALKKKKMEIFLNFALKLMVGVAGIYLINMLLGMSGVYGLVGLNSTNVLVVGILGLPGLAMLYGVGFYFSL